MSEKKTKKKEKAAPEMVLDGGIFENLEEKVDFEVLYADDQGFEDEKLDIFYELRNADLRNFDFYANLSPKLQKQFSPLVAMRWFSIVDDASRHRDEVLLLVNNFLNKGFWELKDHPELQWKLLAMCGSGKVLRHAWINMPKRRKISKVAEFMLQWYPSANDLELSILINKRTRDEFEQFAKSTGIPDDELQELLDAHDIENGIEPQKKSKARKRKS